MFTAVKKSIAVAAGALFFISAAHAADLTGAGATFPYPIYAKWAEAYKKATGTGLNYQSIGSGGGIKQIKAKTVDFGASDMPLAAEELSNKQIAQALFVTVKTVEMHLGRVYRKLDIGSRKELPAALAGRATTASPA